jgi:hypothetical protein
MPSFERTGHSFIGMCVVLGMSTLCGLTLRILNEVQQSYYQMDSFEDYYDLENLRIF